MEERRSGPRGGRGGLLIVALLGIIFLGLIGLLLTTGDNRPRVRNSVKSSELFVIPIRLRIRTQPSAKAPVIIAATRGQKLTLIESRGHWAKVRNETGMTGWAERGALEGPLEHERRGERAAAIRKLPPLDGVVEKEASLFAGPGLFYPLVGNLAPGTRVKIFTRDHDFYAVDLGGREVAYAEIDSLDVAATGSEALDVAGPSATTDPPQSPGATASIPEEAGPAAEPPPLAEYQTPTLQPDRIGVYPAVPPGGTPPEVIDRIVPRFPGEARRAGAGGAVVLRAIVRRDGSIDDVEIIKDLPYGLGEAAREAVSQWRFRPCRVGGEPVDVYYTVTVNFRVAE